MRLPIVTLSFALLTAVLTVVLTEDLGASQTTEQWTVAAEPDVVIESDAEGNELFQVRGITVFADGSAAIMHASLANLLFTDGDGRLVASFGREGEGPGEFRTPELVGLARGDSVSVWDSRLARFHQVARDGGFRTYRPLQWSGRRAPVAVEGDRALTASTQTGAEPGRRVRRWPGPRRAGAVGTLHHSGRWLSARDVGDTACRTARWHPLGRPRVPGKWGG